MKQVLRLTSLACLLMASALSAQIPVTDTDSRRLDDRIRALQKEAERLAGSSRTLLDELRGLEVERNLRAAEGDKADAAVAEAQEQLRQTDTRLTKLEQERVEQLPAVEAQLVNLYKYGSLGYARVLFGASDVRELGRASRTLAALVGRDQRRIEAHRRTLTSLREERNTQQQSTAILKERQATATRAQAAAERALAAHTARLTQIDTERDLTAQYVGELQVARDSLVRQIEGTAPAADPAAAPPAAASTAAAGAAPTAAAAAAPTVAAAASAATAAVPLAPFRGALEWPAAGRLTGEFGQAANRLGGTAVRNGVEIAAGNGTPVRAVHGGAVVHADTYPGFGNLVIVDHGANQYTLYGYLGAISVTVGQTLASGAEVGIVGPSPAGPAALYFELRVDGRSVDPVQWLKPR